jgi:hypothetical protein
MDVIRSTALAAAALGTAAATARAGTEPRCAHEVIAYVAGAGTGAAYRDPTAALGPPTRFTGSGVEPGAVTPFRPAFMPGEIVSVGRGGELVVAFAEPVADDPRNPHGIDLIVYGNAFCPDADAPSGSAAGVFAEGGSVEVSADGLDWRMVAGAEADGGLPTLAYSDVGPYATSPGLDATDPARPVDPAVTPESLAGLGWDELVAAYGGASGGSRIDLASVGLAAARFVRIRTAPDAPFVPEVDAIVAVRPAGAAGDLDGDGSVNGLDLGILLGAWGPCGTCASDMNGDGSVDGLDLGSLLGGWS